MNKNNFLLNKQDYFDYYNQNYLNSLFKKKYPLISIEVKAICLKMERLIKNISKSNFFNSLSEILKLDAQLQVIESLIEILFDGDISEIDVVNLSRQDYKMFLKESLEFPYGEHSLIFSMCE
ncbi:hypothetical protein GVK96_14390 [Enterococcus hirae]|uniref:DUF7006 family protein n=1 Tax=Enterococcus hirae TaxID=1354 RepID=UPI0013778E6C|nr:hypothetical protein [Enterococcus hirae]NBA40616.1 hypothetical protein [Enterococcus hirae]